ncbi:sugar phosphate isomerase/epimerase family protein [Actinoplanes sp. G11-F43]|uniref:sugar phosphate isomerase/epimerase family protein n=1 Tax=Actinoplanes sp. G11-F43 TaxID=3424130 RepID=UPI003D34BE25
MRLRHPSGRTVHLSCGISLDHAEDVTAAVERLDAANTVLRGHFGSGPLSVALRLPYRLAAALAAGIRARTRLRAELDARGLEVVTLSGAPGGGGEQVPPDWSEPARLRHTLDLARVLVDLLPAEEVRGALTTGGLGRAGDWDEDRQRDGARHLSRLSGGLADLAWRVGRAVRAGFQPGPGQVLDSPEQIVAALSRVDKDRLGICLDLATVLRDWPTPEAGIDRLTDAGLSVITARIADPAAGWQPVLRHLLAADTARTEYVDVDVDGGDESRCEALAYVLDELTGLGLVPEQEPCPAVP